MDDVKKILQLVADHMLSPDDAAAIFDRWKGTGKEVSIDSSAIDITSKKQLSEKQEKTQVVESRKEQPVKDLNEMLSSEIITVAAEILRMEVHEVSLKIPMKDYGIDSVTASEITVHFKEKYQIPITPPMLFEVRNFGEFIELLIAQFRDQIASYYAVEEVSTIPYHDAAVAVPGIAAEDDQGVSHVKDVALFEGSRDFDSMWATIERDEVYAEKVDLEKSGKNDIQGNSLIVSIGNEILEFVSFGVGDPLLIIGGLGNDATIWHNLLPKLADKHKVILYYPPGHGKSTLPESVKSMSDVAKLLQAGLEQLNITEPLPVIGYSSGGTISLELALHYPDKVKSLVLISSSAKANVDKDVYEKATYEFEKVSHLFENAAQLLPFSNAAMMSFYKILFDAYDITEDIKSISVPTIALGGEDDEYIPFENTVNIEQAISGAKLVNIPHAGHFVLLTHADDISKRIKDFI